jgi:hypothetical protein
MGFVLRGGSGRKGTSSSMEVSEENNPYVSAKGRQQRHTMPMMVTRTCLSTAGLPRAADSEYVFHMSPYMERSLATGWSPEHPITASSSATKPSSQPVTEVACLAN